MGTKDVPLGHVIYPITTISRYVILIAIWHFTGTISLVVLPSLANVVNIYTLTFTRNVNVYTLIKL